MLEELFNDGTISYRRVRRDPMGYLLVVNLSEDAQEKLNPLDFRRLQGYCHGDLRGEFSPQGVQGIHMPILALGPESAHRQARDLSEHFKQVFDLNFNIAIGLSA